MMYWAVCLLLTFTAQAQIYKWVDEKGQVHYSDEPPENQQAQEVKLKTHKLPAAQVIEPHTTEARLLPETTHIKGKEPAKEKARKKRPGNLVMYATKRCGYCKKARAYFKANKIRYKEFDIDKNQAAHQTFKKLGGKGVPLFAMGRQRMSGFSVQRFERFYYKQER